MTVDCSEVRASSDLLCCSHRKTCPEGPGRVGQKTMLRADDRDVCAHQLVAVPWDHRMYMINPADARRKMTQPETLAQWVRCAMCWLEACDVLVVPQGSQPYPFPPSFGWAAEAYNLHPGLHEDYQYMCAHTRIHSACMSRDVSQQWDCLSNRGSCTSLQAAYSKGNTDRYHLNATCSRVAKGTDTCSAYLAFFGRSCCVQEVGTASTCVGALACGQGGLCYQTLNCDMLFSCLC